MKTMKKTIAVLLCMIMLVLMIPFSSASALESTAELVLDTFTTLKLKGDDVIVSFTAPEDGFYKFYSKGNADTYATLFDSQDNKLCDNEDVDVDNGDYNFSLSYKLNAGQTYYLSVNAWDTEYYSPSTRVKVEKIMGIESSTVVGMPNDLTCVEGYEEMTFKLDGLAIDYTFSDGSVVSWVYGEEWYVRDFTISCKYGLDDNGSLVVTLDCAGIKNTINFTAVENPVDYLEYVGDDVEIYANSQGYYNEYAGYYYYSLDSLSDEYINIHYKDGSVKTAKIWDKVDGYRIETYSTQTDKPWDIGENTAYVSYLGVETEVKVNILPPPFKSITLESAPTKEYVLGNMLDGYYIENNLYEFYPYDIRGLSFTVEYHDGTTRTFRDKDFDIENGTIDGYEYSVSTCSTGKVKECKTTLYYMGYELNYNVKVVQSPIKNVEVVWYPELTDYDEGFEPIFDGMEVEVTYKNGTKKTVVFSDENTSYETNSLIYCTADSGSDDVYVFEARNYMDEKVYVVGCYDKLYEYSGIAFYDDWKVDSIAVSEFSFDDMTIDVTYANGLTDTLEGTIVSIWEYQEGYYDALVKTEKGVITVEIDTLYENGEITGYEINALGHTAKVDGRVVKKGDVDLDGEVSVLDATIIQRYLSEYEQLDELQESVADADLDGDITVMDVTRIQRYIAKQIEKI